MLIICGALVNGPYALITTAVSADLVRGAPQTPPRCPGTPRGCSPFPRGMFCWDFSILTFSMLLKPSGEGQSCHTWCCTPHPPLNSGVSPVAFWPHDCVSALLHLSLNTSRMEIFGGRSPVNFCILLAIQVFAMVWLQAAIQFDLPIHGWV